MPAIKNYLNTRFPDLPFFIVAHSAGGQQIGFMNDLDNITGVVNFAVSTGFYSNMPMAYRLRAYFFFYIFTPISVLLTGYVKGKKFGFMENLPRNVVYEWRSWCAKENYFFDKKYYGKTVPTGNFKDFHFPIHCIWATDDTISNAQNTENFWKHIRGDKGISFTRLVPHEMGLEKIGHFGFFRKVMKDKLWVNVVEKLDALLCKRESR
jgi:predicted alpha/beta hydrolase